MRKETVSLYAASEDGGRFLRFVSKREADALESSGKAEASYVETGNIVRQIGIVLCNYHRHNDNQSPCTLTFAESTINAGAGSPRQGHWVGRGRETAVREKVAAWPFIGDTKAVRVGPRVEL